MILTAADVDVAAEADVVDAAAEEESTVAPALHATTATTARESPSTRSRLRTGGARQLERASGTMRRLAMLLPRPKSRTSLASPQTPTPATQLSAMGPMHQ